MVTQETVPAKTETRRATVRIQFRNGETGLYQDVDTIRLLGPNEPSQTIGLVGGHRLLVNPSEVAVLDYDTNASQFALDRSGSVTVKAEPLSPEAGKAFAEALRQTLIESGILT